MDIVQFNNGYAISFDELFERELMYNSYLVNLQTLNNNVSGTLYYVVIHFWAYKAWEKAPFLSAYHSSKIV